MFSAPSKRHTLAPIAIHSSRLSSTRRTAKIYEVHRKESVPPTLSPHLPNIKTFTALCKKTRTVRLPRNCANYTYNTKHPPATENACVDKSEYEVKYRDVVKPELPKRMASK